MSGILVSAGVASYQRDANFSFSPFCYFISRYLWHLVLLANALLLFETHASPLRHFTMDVFTLRSTTILGFLGA